MKKKPKSKEEYRAAMKQSKTEEGLKVKAQNVDLSESVLEETYNPEHGPTKDEFDDTTELRNLIQVAKIEFPEGQFYTSLRTGQAQKKRLVGIAHVVGWSRKDICRVLNLKINTYDKWIKSPELKAFMHDFKVKLGQQKPDDMWTKMAFKAMKFYDEVLSNPDTTESFTKIKEVVAAKVLDRKYGKPTQPIEHTGDLLKGVLQSINSHELKDLTDEDESSLFDEDTVH